MFVFSGKVAYFLARPDPQKFDRRRGFSNRATAAMFIATVVNFIFSSLNTGIEVALFIVVIRKALTLDIDYPLLEKAELINNALVQGMSIVTVWAQVLPVSIKLLMLDPVFIHARWR